MGWETPRRSSRSPTGAFNGGEAYFLDDNNSSRDATPPNNRAELTETVLSELKRDHEEHFGHD